MNIFGNLVNEKFIVGIGELKSLTTDIPANCSNRARKERQYSFRVFLQASSIQVNSPVFSGETTDPPESTWLNEYVRIQNVVAVQIGELDPRAVRKKLLVVGEVHEDLKNQLLLLFADLVPAEAHTKDSINRRIAKVFETVSQLRDLACVSSPI